MQTGWDAGDRLQPMDDDVRALVAEQVAYYRAHAPDYDNDVAGLHPRWSQTIDELPVTGDVLELACGSGRWTPLLAARARMVTAVDAAPEMLALARQRVADLPVELIEADVFAWEPPRRYDTVFFAFWLTHVPPVRFAGFWSMVGRALAPGGEVCFLDDSGRGRAGERFVPGQATPAVWRRLRECRCLSGPPAQVPATPSSARLARTRGGTREVPRWPAPAPEPSRT
jgi:SAM-dependent methyltransferase